MLTIEEMEQELQNWGTVSDCAKHYGISKERVFQLLKLGRLGKTVQVGDRNNPQHLMPKPYRRIIKGKGGRPKKIKTIGEEKTK